jgi:O-antigen/teichoic acid export membrane protein
MSRARRVFAAFGIGMMNQALAAVGGLWVTRFTIHRIGAHDYGLWVIAAQVLGYLGLLDLGVTALLPRDVSVVVGRALDREARDAELRDLVERGVSLVLLLIPILAVAAVAMVLGIPAEWAPLRVPLAINLALFVLLYPLRVIAPVLNGLQEMAYVGWTQAAAWAATVLATVVLVLLGFGLNALAVAGAVGQLVAAAGGVARMVSRHPAILPRRIRWASRDVVRKHFAPGLWVSLAQIAHLLIYSTDILVVGRILGPEGALRFSFTDKTENLLSNAPFSISNLAGPAIGELKAAGRKEQLAHVVGLLSGVILILSGGIVLAILETNHVFVRAWVGEQYFSGMALTVALLANMMARHWQFPYNIALFYDSGHVRSLTLMAVADGVVSVGLSIFLVHRIGIVGAPLASFIAVLVTQWPAGVILLARESGTSVWATFGPVIPWLVRFVPIAIVAGFAGVYLGHSSLLPTAVVGAVIGLVYIGAMLPLMRRPPLDVYARPYLARIPFLRKGGEQAR